MADVFTKAKRSEVMARIRGRGNKDTELALVKILRANGISGWRRHQSLFGKPDFTFPLQRVVVFVDGCFWHACPRHFNMPANNREFWEKKLEENKQRDRLVSKTLRKKRWHVIRLWEHDLVTNPTLAIRRIKRQLEAQS